MVVIHITEGEIVEGRIPLPDGLELKLGYPLPRSAKMDDRLRFSLEKSYAAYMQGTVDGHAI